MSACRVFSCKQILYVGIEWCLMITVPGKVIERLWSPFSTCTKSISTTNRKKLLYVGQSEPAATNAPVGRSVHWMGCVFSFGAKWGPITVHFFLLLTTVLFFLILFLVLGLFSHDLPPCSLSYLINTTPTLVPYLLLVGARDLRPL